jgi:glycosyltransferase 2 family protein
VDQPHRTDAAPQAERGSGRAHPYRAFALRAGLGVAVVVFLLWRYAGRAVFSTLARENPRWFLATVALYVAGQMLSSYRWQLLARALGIFGRFTEFVRYYFIGMFTNLFVPGLVGGDAARAIYLGRKHDRLGAAIAATVTDRVVGLLGLFWLAAFAALFLNHDGIPVSVTRPVIVIGALALVGLAVSPMLARMMHLLPRPLRRPAEMVAPYLHRPRTTMIPISLSIALHITLAIAQWMLARGLGMSTPISLFVLIVPIANVFASLPLTLNGLGVRETAYLLLFGMAGIGKQDAIALGLLWFAATMLGGLTGAIAFVTTPTPTGHPVTAQPGTTQPALR